jgi:hypothetical protein
MDDVWIQRFSEQNFFSPVPNSCHFRYFQFWGADSFREALAKFLTTFFKPKTPISYNNVSLVVPLLHVFLFKKEWILLCSCMS